MRQHNSYVSQRSKKDLQMYWIHLVCQKHNCTNTESRYKKKQILFDYELCKHLAATVLDRLLVLYLSFLARKGAEITDKRLQKITSRHY